MIFEKDCTGFPTRIHRSIYNAALRLTPLEVSLSDITDRELIESCRQYYAFLLSLFSDMYADPHAYGMIAGENFPDMTLALYELGGSTANIKTFGEHNFFNCEFCQITKSYIPTYDDVMRVLPDDRCAVY